MPAWFQMVGEESKFSTCLGASENMAILDPHTTVGHIISMSVPTPARHLQKKSDTRSPTVIKASHQG